MQVKWCESKANRKSLGDSHQENEEVREKNRCEVVIRMEKGTEKYEKMV